MTNGKDDYQKIPIKKIDISKWNVRTSDKEKGIDELAESILRYGLLQPIVVFQERDKFNLIIGQRRLRAFTELNKKEPTEYKEILARVLPQRPDEEQAKIMSLSENIHRVEVNRQDIVEIITFLLKKHNNSIKRVAEVLGIHPLRVSSYAPITKAPDEIKKMYYNKDIAKEDVKRLMLIAPDDEKKMIEIAKDMPKLTKEEKERLVDAGIRDPKAPKQKLLAEARRPHTQVVIKVPLTPALSKALDNAVNAVNLSREEITKTALVEWLREKGYYKE